jgi:hypothetical protein
MAPSAAARAALRILAPASPGAPGAGIRRAALVALMPHLLQRHHVLDLLEVLDNGPSAGAGGDAGRVVAALRRRPTTCLYRSLAGFASLRAAGEPVRLVIGVRVEAGEVVAHAWLERNGEPVGEPSDPRSRFAEALAHPPRRSDESTTEATMAPTQASRDVILTEMKDGTGLLLDLRSKFYFTLNATGVAVWKLLAAGEAPSARALAERIARDFEAPALDVVERDVEVLLAALAAEGLFAETSR